MTRLYVVRELRAGGPAAGHAGVVDLGFGGEVAEFYHRYRRGYPPAVIDALAAAFGLTGDVRVRMLLGCAPQA